MCPRSAGKIAATPKSQRTRARILSAALELFNTEGVNNVGLREIATASEMTHGNLTYHFPTKSSILEAIFIQAEAEVETAVASAVPADLAALDTLWLKAADMQRRYRYFYLDFVEIERCYPEVAKRHARNARRRRRQLEDILAAAIDAGFVKPERHPGDYERLSHAAWMTLTFWVAERAVFTNHASDITSWNHDFAHIRAVMWTLFRPHLTTRGRKALHALRVFPSA